MNKNIKEENRTKNFKRNNSLESFLKEINNDLWISEKKLLNIKEPEYPIIFVVGPLRSGSTLMTQWLANLGLAYPTNLMSRFYNSPIIASKIQLLLTDERYNFRNEILDFNSEINFESENWKTKWALAPNEFWYFWRSFIHFNDIDYLPTKELFEKVDIDTLKSEFAGIVNVFEKPFALKSMILNYNIDFLNKIFDKAIFIYTRRNPLTNIESALKAREKQLWSIDKWYSFKIPEYEKLKRLSPHEQVAWQIHYINKAIELWLKDVDENKKIVVDYEKFCEKPEDFFNELKQKLKLQWCDILDKYSGEKQFKVTRKSVTDENIINAYKKFSK